MKFVLNLAVQLSLDPALQALLTNSLGKLMAQGDDILAALKAAGDKIDAQGQALAAQGTLTGALVTAVQTLGSDAAQLADRVNQLIATGNPVGADVLAQIQAQATALATKAGASDALIADTSAKLQSLSDAVNAELPTVDPTTVGQPPAP